MSHYKNGHEIVNLKDPMERFYSFVDVVDSGCWEWIGYVGRHGYANFTIRGINYKAHRFSYTILKEDIPEELVLDHLCLNKKCVNPDHLEAVTQAENIYRSPNTFTTINKNKEVCKRGHPFDMKLKNGGRGCKLCRRLLTYNFRRKLNMPERRTLEEVMNAPFLDYSNRKKTL